MYYVYILLCADGTLYTGITLELERRVEEHNSTDLGAKYTKTRRPVRLVYSAECGDRAAAAREEYRIKQLGRGAKMLLIKNI